MFSKVGRLIILILGFAFSLHSQTTPQKEAGTEADTATINALVKQSKEQAAEDPDKAIILATQAKVLSEKINYSQGLAYSLKHIGLGYYNQGKYVEALNFWNQSLQVFEQLKDDNGVANMLNNIAIIYIGRGDDEKGLEYSLRSLKLSEKTGDKLRILSALNTIGSIYYNKKANRNDTLNKKDTWDKALNYFLRALPLCAAIGNNEAQGTISANIGEIYFEKKKYDSALIYYNQSIRAKGDVANSALAYNGLGKVYLQKRNIKLALSYNQKALEISEKLNSPPNVIGSLRGIALVYDSTHDYVNALKFLNKAMEIAEETKAELELKEIYNDLSVAYFKTADYSNAYKYKTKYADVKDHLYDQESDKKLISLQFDFDLEKKQGEINLLNKSNALNELQIKRQKLVKNAFAGGLALVMMIAVIIFRNYRAKVKTNKILDQQKDEIEGLLLNILPAEVAKELQQNGQATPRNFDSVSVMFTDFKSFTVIADKMSPRDLVEELNTCFIAFDHIIGKYNLEKIKTIGDAYMCAGGIPTPDPRHAYNMVKASLEIQEYITQNNQRKVEAGLEAWDLRLGLHVGPIVAGVVGRKKYAYDIWGSTVNIASRMESNGEPGKVNISSDTYELVKNEFNCIYRGKIYAKNVGEIDMYFVENEITPATVQLS